MVGKRIPLTVALLTAALMAPGVKAQQTPTQPASSYGVTRQPYNSTLGSQQQSSYTILYVNPLMGDDIYGTGTRQQPYKTITQALNAASAGTVIVLAPGRYTAETGETFPLRLKPGVTIQGNPNTGQSAIIFGGGNFQSATLSHQNATILTSDRSGLGYVVVSNPHTQGHGVWVESGSPVIRNNAFVANRHTGVYVAGGFPSIEGNYFNQNQVAGLVIYGNSRGSIRGNNFEDTGTAITVATTAVPEIIGNRIRRNNEGIVLLGNAQPTLADNDISQNRRNGVVEVASAAPPIQVAAGTEITSLQLTPAPERSSSAQLLVNSPAPAQEIAVRPAPTPQSQSLNAPTAAPVPVETAPVRSAPTQVAPAQAAPQPTTDSSRLPATAPPEPTIEPEIAVAPTPAATNLATPEVPRSESSPQTSLQALQERAENRTIAAITVPVPTASPSATANPTASDPSTPTTSNLTTPAPEPPRENTASSTASTTDLARLPSLPSTNRLDAPQVSPAGQSALTRPTPEPQNPNPEAATANPAPTQADSTSATQNRVSIADLRNRLLSRESSASSGTTASASQAEPEAVAIAVIPAATTASPTPQSAAPNSPTPSVSSSSTGSGYRLPVPSARIPVGGGGRAIAVSSLSTPSADGGPPALPSRASALGLYYRVFVDGTDETTQQRLRELVPDAFRTQLNGRSVMQAGAYPDEATAQERLQMLLDNGLNAHMEYIP